MRELVGRALAGDRGAVKALVDELSPVVEARVWRVLALGGRVTRQDVEDIEQEVFATLFAHGGRLLRSWDPQRADLPAFVGVIAKHKAIDHVRASDPRSVDPTPEDEDKASIPADMAAPEDEVASRELLVAVVIELRQRLAPKDYQVFLLHVAQEQSVAQVCAVLSMSEQAVHTARHRIKKLAEQIVEELASERPGGARKHARRG